MTDSAASPHRRCNEFARTRDVDTIHGWTGLRPPALDFARLGENVEAFRLLIDIHYSHYRFYANEFTALLFSWAVYRTHSGWTSPAGILDVMVLLLGPILFATSRDTLKKYYTRTAQLLTSRPADRRRSGRA